MPSLLRSVRSFLIEVWNNTANCGTKGDLDNLLHLALFQLLQFKDMKLQNNKINYRTIDKNISALKFNNP